MRVKVWAHTEKLPPKQNAEFFFIVDALMTEDGRPIILREIGRNVFRVSRVDELSSFDLRDYLEKKGLIRSPLREEEILPKVRNAFKSVDGFFFVFETKLELEQLSGQTIYFKPYQDVFLVGKIDDRALNVGRRHWVAALSFEEAFDQYQDLFDYPGSTSPAAKEWVRNRLVSVYVSPEAVLRIALGQVRRPRPKAHKVL